MTRMEAETRVAKLTKDEPRTTGLTFAAKKAPDGGWYAAEYYRGEEVMYKRK